MTLLDEQIWWEAVLAKDARLDGEFYYAVTSTGVYLPAFLSFAAAASC